MGITDYAQEQLGDIVFVELPAADRTFERGQAFGVVESVKAVSDLFMPVGGTILEANVALTDNPELVNRSPYDEGWMIRVHLADPDARDGLLSAEQYRRLREGNSGSA